MTCEDYLSMLETLPVQELSYGEARDHAAYCHDCNRVTRVVAARERNMTLAYAEAYPSASAATVAEQAIRTADRRRVAFYVRAGLGLATAALLALFFVVRRAPVPSHAAATVAERFNLQCLSPAQASSFLRQEIASEHLSIRGRPPLAVIEVRGTPEQVVKVRRALDRVDNPRAARCAAEVIVPKATQAVEVVAPTPARAVEVVVPTGERLEVVVAKPAKAVKVVSPKPDR
jgi:type II secretory pathway component GspD/PulD (secretin)